MEQEQTASTVTTRSAGVKWGLISAAFGIVYFLVVTLAGGTTTEGIGSWLQIAFLLGFIFLAHREYKTNGDGFMNYGQGVGISFWLGLVSVVITIVFMFVYIKFVDTAFLDTIKERQVAKMQEKGASDADIEQGMKVMSFFFTPGAFLAMGLIGGLIQSVICGVIVSIFTQKKRLEPTF